MQRHTCTCSGNNLGITHQNTVKIRSNLGLELQLDCDTKYIITANVDVVVNFLSQVFFSFVFGYGNVQLYANAVERKE